MPACLPPRLAPTAPCPLHTITFPHMHTAPFISLPSLQVRATTTLVDPKKVKAEQERAEAEAIKGRERLADKQSKAMRKFSMPRSRMPQQLNAGG